jgi:hemerythrin
MLSIIEKLIINSMNIQFKWTQGMSVHNDVIDAQHKELFDKLSELLQKIITNNTDNAAEELIHFFEKYMNGHLAYEEAYLKEMNYPYLKEHHEQHEVFTKKYEELKEKISEDDADNEKIIFEIENFMGSWLTSHILIEDQKYARYIQGQN